MIHEHCCCHSEILNGSTPDDFTMAVVPSSCLHSMVTPKPKR